MRRLLALAALFLGLLCLGLFFPLWEWCTRLLAAAGRAGPAGALAYAGAFVPAALLLLPSAPLAIGAGKAFGPFAGMLVAVAGTAVGATAAFAAGRSVGGDALHRLLARSHRLSCFTRALEHAGFEVVFWLRLSPFVPFYLLNYAFGTTGVRARDYLAATALAVAPGCTLYAALGAQLPSAEGFTAHVAPGQWMALAVGVVLSLLAAAVGRRRLPQLVKEAGASPVQRGARAADPAGPPER